METVQKYRIEEKIGIGGMATVYRAFDTELQRNVALKIVHPHLLDQDQVRRRFQNEARAIATLSHENIIKLFDFGSHDGTLFLAMEYIEGITLEELLRRSAPLPNLVVLEISRRICSGLHAAHSQGIYHRDIKPANIMIDRFGSIRLMDFGLAYFVNQESCTITGSFIGTPSFISPEQAKNEKITDKSDIFSTGAVLYLCCTGRPPFEGETVHAVIHAIANRHPLPAYRINPHILDGIHGILATMLENNPRERCDAPACIRLVQEVCAQYDVRLGRERIARFLESPEEYRESENREIHEKCRDRALIKLHRREHVAVVKLLNEAGRFGRLSSEELRILAGIKSRGRLRRTLPAIAAVISLLAVLLYIGPARRGKTGNAAPPAEPRVPVLQGGSLPETAGEAPEALSSEPASLQQRRISRAGRAAAARDDEPGTGSHAPVPSGKSGPGPAASRTASRGAYGYARIITNPPWTQVRIDSIYRGRTPITVPLWGGDHVVHLSREKCVDFHDSISITPGDTLFRRILMRRRP